MGDGTNSLATEPDFIPVDQQNLDDYIQSNAPSPLQSALENSAASLFTLGRLPEDIFRRNWHIESSTLH